jgi:hypothetical protein
MVDQLLEMYREGAITGYQVVIDCLHMLDPNHPELVLAHLPDEILDEMMAYTRRYDPARMRSMTGAPPVADQVNAAQAWIDENARQRLKRNIAS